MQTVGKHVHIYAPSWTHSFFFLTAEIVAFFGPIFVFLDGGKNPWTTKANICLFLEGGKNQWITKAKIFLFLEGENPSKKAGAN